MLKLQETRILYVPGMLLIFVTGLIVRGSNMSRMYNHARTWNPFVGCLFDCVYCRPSFQRQLMRQKQRCLLCYYYLPHYHPERLKRIPNSKIVFVCGCGDISWCSPKFVKKIIERIKEHNKRCPDKIYYFQSKDPACFSPFLDEFPENVFLLTTLETNRDKGYMLISHAPMPSVRFERFLNLDYPRKALTIEPIMDFDLPVFLSWIKQIKPKFVYVGYNSRPKQVKIPEPPLSKTLKLIEELEKFTKVYRKDLRGGENGLR